jgi:hypothetical protein
MICERVKEQLAEYLSGNLEGEAREKFIGHLEQCGRCRGEVEELGALWRGLEFLPNPQPNAAMRGRFNEMPEAYRFGMEQSRPRATYAWWQLAAACGLLALGIGAGRMSSGGGSSPAGSSMAELKQLQSEMQSMRQLVTLSLLQQQSASARLRGVTYSYQMEQPDPQVQEALLYAVNHDANINVRLSAVDALRKFVRVPAVSKALMDALPVQDSPLVQIALIDMLVESNDGSVIPSLRKLQGSQTNEAVRQRAEWGLRKLGVA